MTVGINLLGGVRLRKVDKIEDTDIIEIRPPETFSVPVMCTESYPMEISVSVGDFVKDGSLIAKPTENKGAFVYSPTSGKVVDIIDSFTPTGLKCKHVVILNDRKMTEHNFAPLVDKRPMELLKRLAVSGIVDANFGGKPTYLRYTLNSIEKQFTLYVVMSNTDPYLTANESLTIHRTAQVVGGAKYFAQLLASKQIVFIFTKRAKIARKVLKKYIKEHEPQLKYKIKYISNRYPSDNIELLRHKFKPRSSPIVETKEKKVFVEDAITCHSFFNSVEYGKPCNYRVVTISGNNIVRPGNYVLKNGTTFQHVLEVVGTKQTENSFKIINGGIMSGLCQYSADVASNPETQSINFVDDKEISFVKESVCINCGRCASACPMNLLPNKLDELCIAKKSFDAEKWGIKSCIECGCCSYVCPAKRYLTQRIVLTKKRIIEGGRK